MRNEIDIKEKSRGAIRNISGLNEEFQGMKLQFHRDGTPVSSYETPAHTSKNHPAFRNLSLLTLLLLFFSAGWNENGVWGQNGATITKASNTNTVHTKTQTIYVDGSREIYIPELRINRGETYDWYVHWYPESGITISKSEIKINVAEAQIRGGAFSTSDGLTNGATYSNNIYTSPSRLFSDNGSGFWWADKADNVETNHAVDASAITVSLVDGSTEGTLICDISNNTDDDWDGSTYKEPTLLKRYVYIIKSAKEYVENLNANGPEEFVIDFPAGSTSVNFSMPSLPTNYFWGTDVYIQGEQFAYSTNEDGPYTDFSIILKGESNAGYPQTKVLSSQQVQQVDLSSVSESITYYVKAKKGSEYSPILAKFIFNPTSETGFMFEKDLPANRKPWEDKSLYEEIGVVDFDIDKKETNLSVENNVSETSLPSDQTVYGFLQKNIASTSNTTNVQNQYGLFRSANDNISAHKATIGGNAGKTYLWIPTATNSNLYGSKALYDRTHHNDTNYYGYFYYIDASDDPGTIVDVDIDGTLCGYTELVVTAWLADMTRANSLNDRFPLAPNINLILKGDDIYGNEVVLHRFTSGDAQTKYENGVNQNLMEWQQLCYRIRLTSDVENYTNFHLEVQNNEPHTDGADYAIDDVRIYKTLPNIKVRRENNCDASTLIVGTDYSTILRNMGWSAGEEVAKEDDYLHTNYDNLDYRKYRYGLMGEEHQFKNSHAGNVYFSFLSEDKENWLAVNKAVEKYSKNAAMSLRVAVSTIQNQDAYEFYIEMADDSEKSMDDAKKQAMKNEYIMNYRAVLDYNKDIELWQKEEGSDKHPKIIPTEGVNIEDKDFDEEKYQAALIELFGRRLNIPRIRCPWYDKTNEHLYLALIDVNNTDLRYRGEIIGENQTATGKYWVVTFSAAQVADSDGGTTDTIDKNGACTLMSEFTVEPATTVLIDAKSPGDPEVAVCVGTMHQITAYLNFYEKESGDPVSEESTKNLTYIFDWYLGPMTEYDDITLKQGFSIKEALNAYRSYSQNSNDPIELKELKKWEESATGENKEKAQLLVNLMENNKLLSGTKANEPFDMPVNTERMVAMPYLPDVTIAGKDYVFCDAETEVNLEAVDVPIPEMYHGFVGVEYPEEAEVALRLGQRHMEKQNLDLPIYKVNNMADEADHLELGGTEVDIYLADDISVREPIGVATSLYIPKPNEEDGKLTEQGELTFALYKNAKNILHEGQRYILLIPFAQYKNDKRLDSACDGLLRLPVKVVPEYLTWKGVSNDNWYNDGKWNQSTRGELHFGGTPTDDANGSDEITDAYSPLYFTRITILGDSVPDNSELSLPSITYEDEVGTLNIENVIRYDMAVDTILEGQRSLDIIPYYINKVNQIYFKPGATLLNQHLLNYQKAWVEFEMTPGKDYWMASPLKDVYAGDMYAPTAGGQQRTPAFESIMYDDAKNGRWDPAFYQKAWNGDIRYASSDADKNGIPEETEIKSVKAVSSNWSIEYNDVTVPYSIGKGFYSRVEKSNATDNTVMVRLPKADTNYKYEYSPSTRVLDKVEEKTSQPNMADLEEDGSYVLDLASVDNDNDHFLVGNPYMAYLQMNGDKGFLTVNNDVIANKYWTVDGETIVVGTPDVGWSSESNTGYIAPLQAFFVERKDYDPNTTKTEANTEAKLKVSFNVSMTVSAPKKEEADTRSYTATNPQLTLTASSAKGKSRAAVVQSFDASNQYESERDAVTLLDSELDAPTVYTVAGNYAAAVNAVHDCQNIPLGVYAKDNEEVELTVEGASQLTEPLYLYDAVTRSSTPIEGDSYTLNLTGSSHGRYFLTTDAGNIRVESDIRIYSPNGGQLIIAASPSDKLKQVQIYDLSGRMVESRKNIGASTCQLNVTKGIYIVRVISEQGSAEAKLRIR